MRALTGEERGILRRAADLEPREFAADRPVDHDPLTKLIADGFVLIAEIDEEYFGAERICWETRITSAGLRALRIDDAYRRTL